MRTNEYTTLEDFLSEYTGKRDPANNLWYGLEFKYDNLYYRLDYVSNNIMLMRMKFDDNTSYPASSGYEIVGEFQSMNDLLECVIDGKKPFKEVITDQTTELLSKD